jgi:SPP1 gp7 family putative phage head morphogenesis protein
VRRAHELTKQLLYPALANIIYEVKSALPKRARTDDAIDDLAAIIARIRESLGREFTDTDLQFIADSMGTSVDQVARANSRRLFEQYGKYGLDLTIGFNSNATRAALSMKVKENVQLIKTMSDRHFSSLQSNVLSAITQGKRVEEIESIIDDRFSSMESNAELIARDQVGKLNGQLTEMTQTEMGLTRYRWRGVGDQRERDSHRALEGEVFSWAEPPIVDGESVNPGIAIQCRCYAEPVIEDLLD